MITHNKQLTCQMIFHEFHSKQANKQTFYINRCLKYVSLVNKLQTNIIEWENDSKFKWWCDVICWEPVLVETLFILFNIMKFLIVFAWYFTQKLKQMIYEYNQ